MGTKKIAFEVQVGITQADVNEIISYAEEYLFEEFGVKVKLKNNAAVLEIIKKGIGSLLAYSSDNFYGDEVIDHIELQNLFKEQIEAAEKKRIAMEEAKEAKEYATRLKTAGVMRMHPDDLAKAVKILKNSGIEVTV